VSMQECKGSAQTMQQCVKMQRAQLAEEGATAKHRQCRRVLSSVVMAMP
jgi:hypothetical protein